MNTGIELQGREGKAKLSGCLRSSYEGDVKYYPLFHCNKTNK